MDAIVKFLEKHQALFDKISRNIYLVAIKDGFLSNMPIVLFSSLFLLLSTLPAYVGIALPSEVLDFFNKILCIYHGTSWHYGGRHHGELTCQVDEPPHAFG